ncbi:hypothetical protein WEI85_20925 [Actinomycetes bacterium KLBMP 9797]
MIRFGMLGLALGYFLWYTPYAALTKAVSSGLLPGMDGPGVLGTPSGGLVLLPAAALGTLAGSAAFLTASGWWRHASRRRMGGRQVFWPSRPVLVAGLFMSLVIATTTLNFTFAGVSILFMLLMMRGGVLVLSPIVDAVRGRQVRANSWLALGLSLLAVTIALSDVANYVLTVGAVLSLALYFIGYIGRFEIMSRVAKTGDQAIDRQYLVGEQLTASVAQVALCVVLALAGLGPVSAAVREGFTSFLLTPAALPAFGIGLLYAALYVYGTLIYLDPREYSWCVPANRCASLVAGLVSSYGLTWLTGIAAPGPGQLVATVAIGLAIFALSYPALRTMVPRPRVVLFVCGGNTGRSAMAEAIARVELAATPRGRAGRVARALGRGWAIRSAGLHAPETDAPMAPAAVEALHTIGVRPHRHRSRQLTRRMCQESATVYCMTREQRTAIEQLAPEARGHTFCIDPARDIPDPAKSSDPAAYLWVARDLNRHVRARIREQVTVRPLHAQPQVGG